MAGSGCWLGRGILEELDKACFKGLVAGLAVIAEGVFGVGAVVLVHEVSLPAYGFQLVSHLR